MHPFGQTPNAWYNNRDAAFSRLFSTPALSRTSPPAILIMVNIFGSVITIHCHLMIFFSSVLSFEAVCQSVYGKKFGSVSL